MLDPDFARNRTLYFAYFAPPKGEPGGTFPLAELYDNVWSVPLAAAARDEDRHRARGAREAQRRRARASKNVDVIAEGAERRIALARDGTLFAIGSDRFWRYESKLDGMEHDFTAEPDIRRNFSGRVLRVNKDGSIPKDNPWLSRATVRCADLRAWPEGSGRRRASIPPPASCGWSITARRAATRSTSSAPARTTAGPMCRYGRQYDARQADGRKNVLVGNGKTSMPGVEEPRLLLGAFHRAVGHGVLHRQSVSRLEGQSVRRRHGRARRWCGWCSNGERVVAEERLLTDLKRRIREVRQGPDGALYIFAGDALMRVSPR